MMSEKAKGQQLLRNPGFAPTSETIADGLGEAYNAYTQLVAGLEENYGITLMDWRYYNDSKAWLSKGEYKWTTPRGAKKVKPIFWLSIWEGFFKVSFFFSTNLQVELQSLPISEEAKGIVANAKPMGKTMRFIPIAMDIETDRQLSDVYAMAEFRKTKA